MSVLSNKLRKAREIEVPAGSFKFTVLRPTDLEMIELRKQSMGVAILPFVIGWDGVTELAMLGTGAPHPLDFDEEACAEWLSNRLDLLTKIIDAVFEAYADHARRLSEEVKN